MQKQWREANASRLPPKKKKVNRAPPPSSPSSPSGSDYSPTPADDDASDQDFILDSGEEDEEDFTCKKRKEVGPPPLDSAIEGAVFEPDLHILLRDIYENLSQEKRKAFCEFVEDLKTKRKAEEIPSFREALLQQTPQVVGEDIWQHCIDIQRKEANPKPRGRPPNGLNGNPKVWNASRGGWEEDASQVVQPAAAVAFRAAAFLPDVPSWPAGDAPACAARAAAGRERVRAARAAVGRDRLSTQAQQNDDIVLLTTAEKHAVLYTIAQLGENATQKEVRRAVESALGAPEGALDEKKAAVKEVCEEEMSKRLPPKKRKAAPSYNYSESE